MFTDVYIGDRRPISITHGNTEHDVIFEQKY